MSNRTWTKTSLLILTLTAAAERAPAATICVQPMGMGGCAPTIQAGVDRAAAGDEVRILPGVYFENVIVPASKTGLQIVGVDRPNTILDPSPYGDRLIIHDGPGLLLNATDVRVRNLTFRNGSFGITIEAEAARAVVQEVRFRGTHNSVTFRARGVQILSNEFEGGSGIFGFGPGEDSVIRNNTFKGVSHSMILDAVIPGTDRPQVIGNRVDNVHFGLFADSDESVFRGNDVQYAFESIVASGDNITVENNTINRGFNGIVARCAHDADPNDTRPALCARAVVRGNHVADTLGFASFFVAATGPGLAVRNNTLLRSGAGMSVNGEPMTFQGNVVRKAGQDLNGHCFEVLSSGSVFRGNTAVDCANAGFYVNGSRNELRDNTARQTAENGFTVDGLLFDGSGTAADNILAGNAARANAAQGIAIINGALRTQVTGNTALQNRTDFCDEGVLTIVSGNVFGTVGPCAVLH